MDPMARDNTQAIETRRRHAIENRDKAAAVVQDLEVRLGIQERWAPGADAFQEAKRMLAMREYQRALDSLEGLVVARIFELTRMNRAGMGESIVLCSVDFEYLLCAIRLQNAKAYRKSTSSALSRNTHRLGALQRCCACPGPPSRDAAAGRHI